MRCYDGYLALAPWWVKRDSHRYAAALLRARGWGWAHPQTRSCGQTGQDVGRAGCTASLPPPPVLTATVNTTIGATFTDGVAADLYLDVGNFSVGGKISGAFKVTYHLVPVTSGASYITASGKQYP